MANKGRHNEDLDNEQIASLDRVFTNHLSPFLGKHDIHALQAIAVQRFLKADTNIVNQGQATTELFFVASGIVRYFVVDDRGNEANKTFTRAPCFVGSTTALIKNQPARISLAVMRDTPALAINWSAFQDLMRESHPLESYYRQGLEQLFVMKEERESSLLLESAQARYLAFLASHEDILDQIPQYHIASYLGISPVSLSRIKSQLTARTPG